MNTLHFTVSEIEPKYYADGEDAYAMRRELKSFEESSSTEPAKPEEHSKSSAVAVGSDVEPNGY